MWEKVNIKGLVIRIRGKGKMPAPLVTESRLPSGTRVADSLGNRRRQFLTGGGIERDCASPLVGRLYDRTVRLQRM
jgi:hypothetical protein